MNPKSKGEKGERIVIGELAKYDLDVALPMSDNLPFDLIIITPNKLFKVQIKTSTYRPNKGAISFDLTSNNWNKKTVKKYTLDDCDIMICCDCINVYLLLPNQFVNKKSFSIRDAESKNNQEKLINRKEDFILSDKRIFEVFNINRSIIE